MDAVVVGEQTRAGVGAVGLDSDAPASPLWAGLNDMETEWPRQRKQGSNLVIHSIAKASPADQEAAIRRLIRLARLGEGQGRHRALMVLSRVSRFAPESLWPEVTTTLLEDCMVARAERWPSAPFRNMQLARKLLSPEQIRGYVLFLVDMFAESDESAHRISRKHLPGLRDVVGEDLRAEVCDRLFENRSRDRAGRFTTSGDALAEISHWIAPTRADRYLAALMEEWVSGNAPTREEAIRLIGDITHRASPPMRSRVAAFVNQAFERENDAEVGLALVLALGELVRHYSDSELQAALPYLLLSLEAIERTLHEVFFVHHLEEVFPGFPESVRVALVRFWMQRIDGGWSPTIGTLWNLRNEIPWILDTEIVRTLEAYERSGEELMADETRKGLAFFRARLPPGGVSIHIKRN